jgi:hypothetical protein
MAIDAKEVREIVKDLRNLHPRFRSCRRAADLLEQLASRLNRLEEWVRKRAAARTITLGEPRAFHVVRVVPDECDD